MEVNAQHLSGCRISHINSREEQHDDQVLHELLRCFKALSTSSIGCSALRSFCPTPSAQLVALLYSDKKPGEVATRQLIVELLLLLFDLYSPSSLPATGAKVVNGSLLSGRAHPREAWESQSSVVTSNLVTPHKNFFLSHSCSAPHPCTTSIRVAGNASFATCVHQITSSATNL